MKKIFFLLTLVIYLNNIYSQNISLNDKIPVDDKIIIGTLDNGMKYYIRHNEKPENRAELRLAVNAGSILEDDNQLGLAHFTEHMAFNGTKNFKEHEIINYLESIGMRFGPDINAYTGFDETVYMLQVPTDSAGILEKGFTILKEWASNVSFEDEEIDKERGVIVEEWRSGRGANARIRDNQFPILFNNSRYAERLPIGKKEILENFKYETLKKFYNDWYRPELMAVIAIGDFDKEKIEKMIIEIFSDIPGSNEKVERKLFPVPDHEQTLFTIATDPELTQTSINIYYKHDIEPQDKVENYRKGIIENLYNSMLNSRFAELTQQADPPFLYGYSSSGRFIRAKDFYFLGAAVKADEIERGLEALLTEAKRVNQFGFTASELERHKSELLANMEQAYNEREKTESSQFAAEYIRNFLTDEPIPGIEYEFMLYKELMPGITLEEVNNLAEEFTGGSRVIAVSAPQKENLSIPSEENLKEIINKVDAKEVTAYDDKISDLPLIENIPAPASIISESKDEALGITELELSNGVKVLLKNTDFKNDEVLLHGFSPGGSSLVALTDYIPAATASAVVNQSGVGNFNMIQLQKILAGKVVNVNPYINELAEGISGSAAPKDIETMFQLIYLYFTSPRVDSSAYLSYMQRLRSYLENRTASPDAAFQDTLQVTLSQYNPRYKPWDTHILEQMDMMESFEKYKERFADASDFTFAFVGNFNIDSIKGLIQTYLGNLPSIKRDENWRDLGIDPPDGVVEKKVLKGLEPKSRVSIVFTGDFKWDYQERYEMISMIDVLRIKLREVLREDKGGTYGVGVGINPQKIPDEEYTITISFGCNPERVDELVESVFQQIDSLKSHPVDNSYITKVKETQRREFEVNTKENGYWLNTIYYYYFYNLDTNEFNKYLTRVENLSAEVIKETAEEYFNMDNYVKVVLYPEETVNP